MGTDTLTTALDGTIIPSDHNNAIKGALTQDFLPRNTSGVVTDEAGDLGSSSIKWKDLYVKSLNILPTGMMTPYAGSTAPEKWLLTNGSTIGNIGSGATLESADYEALFELLKTSWGNAGTEIWASGHTVLLPDTRGRFVRSWDNGAGRDSGRAIGTTQAGDNISHNHTSNSHSHQQYATSNLENNNTPVFRKTSVIAEPSPVTFNYTGYSATTTAQEQLPLNTGAVAATINNSGSESRPINLSANYIIKI